MRIFVIMALCLGLLTGCFSTENEEKALLDSAHELEKQGDWAEVRVKIDEVFALNPKNVEAFLTEARLHIAGNDIKAAIDSFNKALENDPRNAEAMLGLAKIYLAGKRVGDAQSQIDKLLSQDPQNMEARGLKATALVLGGDLRGADEAFAKILSDDPRHTEAILGRFGIAMEEGRQTEAWQMLEEALAANPEDSMLHERAAMLYHREGNLEKTEAEMKVLIGLHPEKTQYTMNLLDLYGSSGNMEKAEELLRASLAAHPEEDEYRSALAVFMFNTNRAEEAFALLDEVNPPTPGVRLTLAQLNLYSGKFEEGMSLLRSVADDPEAGELGDIARVRLAMRLADTGKFDEADLLLQSVLANDPENEDALKLKGKILFARGKFDESLKVLEQAAQLNSDDGDTALTIFRVFIAKGEPGKGADILRAFIRQYPHFVQGRLALASYYAESGQPDNAAEQLTELLEIHPSKAEVYLLLGDVEVSRREIDKAKEYFELAGKEPGGELASLMRLGNMNIMLEKPAEALKYFEQALKDFPDEPEPAQGKFLALMQQKKYQELYDWVTKRAKERGNDPDAQELAARLNMMAGKPKDAEGYLLKAREIAPDSLMPITRLIPVYLELNRRADAIALLRENLEKFPPLVLTLAQVLGESKEAAEQDEAEKLYREVLAVDPGNVVANNNLADLVVRRYGNDPARLEEARVLAEAAALSNDPIALDTLGWIQHLQGNNDAALISLGKAANLDPNTPVIVYHYAAALAGAGKTEEAKDMLKKLLETFPEFPGRKDADALFKSL